MIKTKLLVGTITMCSVMIVSNSFADSFTTNQTVPGVCNVSTLGVSSGTRAATANFEPDSYACEAGTYLPANATACATCTAGNYCTGGTYTFNANSAQGAHLCEDRYENTTSDSGTTSVGQCYYTTLATCPTISGPTSCDPHAATCEYTNNAVLSAKFYPDGGTCTQNCTVTFTCATGYTKATTTAPTLPRQSGNGYQYRSHLYPSGASSNNDNDLSAGEWKVTWTSGTTTGTVKGVASCSTAAGIYAHSTMNGNLLSNSADASDDGRRYCWCKPTTWTPDGGDATLLSAAWVFRVDDDDGNSCAYYCAYYCARSVSDDPDLQSVVFGSVGASENCVANTITLNWGDGNGGVHATNSCEYDGAITTPTTAPTAPRGHVFTGWSFD